MADFFRFGAFSVWGKGTPSPEKEAYQLQRRADQLFNASGFADKDRAKLAIGLVNDVADKFDVSLPIPLTVNLALVVDELMESCGAFLPRYDLSRIDLPGAPGRAVREALREQVRFFETPDRSRELFSGVIQCALSHVIGRLALNPAYRLAAAETDPGHEDGLSQLLIDYVGDVSGAVDGILRCFHTSEPVQHGLFKRLRDRFFVNTVIASGYAPTAIPRDAKLRWPAQSPIQEPETLAATYLDGTPFAELFEARLPAAIPDEARFEHTHILAGSGHGKTQLLSQLILQDIERAKTERRSIIVMDSQGDLISGLMQLADIQHTELGDRLVVVDPTDFDYPIALNPFSLDERRLSAYSPADRERVIFGAVDLFEHFFSDLLGSELTSQQGTVFKFLIRLLIEIPGATLITLRDLMDDPKPFIPHMQRLQGSARAFFEREFLAGGYNQARRQIARRLWAVLSNPVFERIFSSPVNKVDWFTILQGGHIVLINTAKDYLRPDASQLFGRFLTAQITQGIFERASVPETKRTPTMFYLDEAQEYADKTVELLLSQGRKYRVGLTLAHQHLDQLSTSQRSGLLSNTSVKLVGGVNRKDAQTLAGEMCTSPEKLQAMRKREGESQFAMSVRHVTDGVATLTVPLGALSRRERAIPDIVEKRRAFVRQAYGRLWEPDQLAESVRNTAPQSAEPVTEIAPVAQPGRGSPAHKAEQQRIKTLAHAMGYGAEVEATLERGLGAVDVLITNAATKIGVEVSLTTPPQHEVANIQKCLSAGCDYVVSTAEGRDHLRAIEELAWKEISAGEISKVLFLLPADVEGFLQTHQRKPEENMIMGYHVTSTVVPASSEDKRRRRERLEWLLERVQGDVR